MRTHEGQSETLKPQQFQEVIDHVYKNSKYPIRDIAILQVSYRCGLRAMEIAGLKLSDILDINGDIKTTVTLRKKTTKGHKGGSAFFTHPEVRLALSKYINEVRNLMDVKVDNLFISRKSTAFHQGSMSRLFTNIYTKAGYHGCTSHAGRKSLAVNLNEQNVSVYNIQQILRHSSITTTVNHYLKVDKETLATLVGNA